MADFFCSFLDLRYLTTNYNLGLFLPSKHNYSSALHSHNSRISSIRRRPLHLTLLSRPCSLTPSCSDFDVISTHEHSDGSILFRFGDPRELAKNVKTEESKTVKEEIEGGGENGSTMVKVEEGDDETKVIAKKAERAVTGSGLTEVADRTNSVVGTSDTITVVEVENESCEKLLECPNDAELPVLTSSNEMEVISTPNVDIEHIENVEECLNEEYEDSSPVEASMLDESSKIENNIAAAMEFSENKAAGVTSPAKEIKVTPVVDIEQTGNVEEGPNQEFEGSLVDPSILKKNSEVVNNITTVALLEKETADIISTDIDIAQTGNTEEGLTEEYEDSSANTSILDENSEVVNNITTASSLEKETADNTSTPDIDIEHAGNAEKDLDEVHEESSANASKPDRTPEMENNISTLESSEKETADVTTLVSLAANPIVAVPDNDGVWASFETVVTTDVPSVSEHQNIGTEMQSETIEDGTENFDSNFVSPSPQPEPAITLSKEIEEQNLQVEMQNLAIGKHIESDVNEIKALEMQNVMHNGTANDTYDAEAKSPLAEAPRKWSIDSEDQASGAAGAITNETVGYGLTLGSGRTEVDDNVLGGDLIEASIGEVTVLKSAESTPTSQEMLTTDFVLSSGAALLPHPSKVLTGGEDAYFIAGQKWLGVADGVSQWSLEGSNPGVYAQELIKNCEKLISDCSGDSINNPVELLNLSVAETSSPGSSTVLIAQFDGQALHVANIGDSGFIVLRHGSVYKRSSPMHHVFHFPLQIENGDDPSSLAEFHRVDLEEDDVIITATDGLLDNLYDQEVSSIVMKSLDAGKNLEEIAELLATKAQEIGSCASVRSPFADDAQAAGFAGYTGGKLDDVAVIVSTVQRQSKPQNL